METITAIVLFNGRLDKESRREYFVPTVISAVSILESHGSSHSGGHSSENITVKIRIPYDAVMQEGRTYVKESVYKRMDNESILDHWTLRKGDCIIASPIDELPDEMTLPELEHFAEACGTDLIRVIEYADNTIRGSQTVKHWRIGGA